jgi:hypothetical protein
VHIGPALAEARTEAGMTVEDVSDRTRIRRTIINDIERDDYSSCGGDFYARGHIRAIAKAVGADPVPLIEEYDESTAARDSPGGNGAGGNGAGGNGSGGNGDSGNGATLRTGPDPEAWLQAEGGADALFWQPAAGLDGDDQGTDDADAWPPAPGFAPPAASPAGDYLETRELPAQRLPGPARETAPQPVVPYPPSAGSAPGGTPANRAGKPAGLRGAAGAGPQGAIALQQAAARIRQARAQLTARISARTGQLARWISARADQLRSAPAGPVPARSGPAEPGSAESGPAWPAQFRDLAAGLRRAGAEAAARLSRLQTTDLQPSRIIGGAAILLAALILILYGIFSGSAHGSARRSAPPRHPAPARHHPAPAHGASAASHPASAPAAAVLRPAGVSAFGPAGPADGDNRQSAGQALSSRGEGWHTNWYTTARFGGLQSGTGLLIDMGRTVTVSRLAVRLGPAGGAAVQLRAGGAVALSALRPVAAARGQGGTVVLAPGAPVRARYLLIWFTRLPRDSAGTYQAAVNGISVTGSATPS